MTSNCECHLLHPQIAGLHCSTTGSHWSTVERITKSALASRNHVCCARMIIGLAHLVSETCCRMMLNSGYAAILINFALSH